MEVILYKAPNHQVLDFDKYHHLKGEMGTFEWIQDRLSDAQCINAWIWTFCQSFTVSLSIFLDWFLSFFGWHFSEKFSIKDIKILCYLVDSEINETLAIYLCGDGLNFEKKKKTFISYSCSVISIKQRKVARFRNNHSMPYLARGFCYAFLHYK